MGCEAFGSPCPSWEFIQIGRLVLLIKHHQQSTMVCRTLRHARVASSPCPSFWLTLRSGFCWSEMGRWTYMTGPWGYIHSVSLVTIRGAAALLDSTAIHCFGCGPSGHGVDLPCHVTVALAACLRLLGALLRSIASSSRILRCFDPRVRARSVRQDRCYSSWSGSPRFGLSVRYLCMSGTHTSEVL